MKISKMALGISNILILAAALALLFTDALPAYNLKEYYPLREGNAWVYRFKANENGTETTSQEIAKIKGTENFGEVETKKMLSGKLDNQCVAIDSEGVKLYKYWESSDGDYEIYEPPKMLFPSIEVGEKRTYPVSDKVYTIKNVIAEPSRDTGTLTITLSSVEDVEVPAGKFKDCLKFISVYEYKRVSLRGSGKDTLTTWLAPGIGRVKSYLAAVEYNLDTKKEYKLTELLELTEASINGNKLSP